MELTDVPPPTRPTLNVVFGLVGYFEIGDFGDGAAHGLNGVGYPEGAVTVSTGAFESHAIAHAADTDIDDAQAVSIHGNELVDLARHAFGEKSLHAAKISQAFFTDIRDEGDGARRLDLGLIQSLYCCPHHS